MIQSLKLLQVNTLQLEQLLRTELEMNPVLETSETQELEQESPEKAEKTEEPAADETPKEEQEIEVKEDPIDWEEYLEDGFDAGGRMSEDEGRSDDDRFEPTAVYQQSLTEFRETQLFEK